MNMIKAFSWTTMTHLLHNGRARLDFMHVRIGKSLADVVL